MGSARDTTRVGVRTRARTPVIEQIVPSSGWTEDSAGHYLLVDLPEFRREEVKLQVDSSGRILVKGERQVNEWKRVHFRLTFPEPVDSDMDNITGKFDGGILYVIVPKQVKQKSKESETAKAGNGELQRAENYSHQHENGEVERAENYSHQHGNGDVETEDNDSHQHGNGEVERAEENDKHPTNVVEGRRDLIPSQHDNHTEFPEQVIRKWKQESMSRSAAEVLWKNKGIVVTAVIAFSLGLLVSRKFNSTIN